MNLYMHSVSLSKYIVHVPYKNVAIKETEHRSCIPDLAPSDFHLFPALKRNHADHRYTGDREVERCVIWVVVVNTEGLISTLNAKTSPTIR
jgi:hypothetical protein